MAMGAGSAAGAGGGCNVKVKTASQNRHLLQPSERADVFTWKRQYEAGRTVSQ
jgi:hypothetical protein